MGKGCLGSSLTGLVLAVIGVGLVLFNQMMR
jgi:hypothetical protein